MAMEISTQRPDWQELNAVQISVALDDIEPRVWRRLVVPLGTTLAELHSIIQAAMGWMDTHMHEFEVGGLSYGDIEVLSGERSDDDPRVYDANEVRMRDFSRQPGTSFKYIYDYGDNWRHTVTLDEVFAVKSSPKTATCVEGARCCPPEDVGGTSGYFEFLRVLLAPDPDEIDEQRHLKRWSGGKFDPERFDVAKANKAVRGALKKRRD